MEQGQITEVSIEDLPAEMLQIVLKYLDVPSLLACRLVCWKWNEMCIPILHTRPETELFFHFSANTVSLMKCEGMDSEFVELKGKVIQDFVECVTQSENSSSRFSSSPFTRLALFNIQEWDESITNFLSVVSPTVICLKLQFAPSVMKEPRFTEKLRTLLLHETPCVKEFGLGIEKPIRCMMTVDQQRRNAGKSPKGLKLALFPSRNLSSNPASILLPKLKVLQVGGEYDEDLIVGIFLDILRIAPNLVKIEGLVCNPYWDSTICTIEDLIFFLNCGKLWALKFVSFDPTSKFLSDWKKVVEKQKLNSMEISSLFKIEDLQLSFDETKEPNIKSVKSEWMKALQLLEQIFEGSKNTLEKIWMTEAAEFPRGFSFPTFTKLARVEFSADRHVRESLVAADSMFPPGCRRLNIFPNVKTLSLGDFSSNLKHFFPREDSIPLMPSVHTISFEAVETIEEDIEIMALLCPNLKKLELKNVYFVENRVYTGKSAVEDFPTFGLAVFKNMKNLESLHLIIDADAEANSFPALDSTFTGISKENCLRLFNESTKVDDDPQEKLRRESELKGLKVNESILDLPNLKELKITVQSQMDYSSDDEDAAYKYKFCVEKAISGLSRVSELYGFQFMPGLKYEIIGGAYF